MAWGEGICPGCNYRHDSDDFVADLCVYCTTELPEKKLLELISLGLVSQSDKQFINEIIEARSKPPAGSS